MVVGGSVEGEMSEIGNVPGNDPGNFWENSRFCIKKIWDIDQISVKINPLKPSTRVSTAIFIKCEPQILCLISILTIFTYFRLFLDHYS